jgi:TatD DNase family protein
MGLIDSHTHLDSFARRGELDAILQRADEAGVEALVTVGTASDDWELYREMAAAHPGVIYHTVGLHPCSVDEDWEKEVAQMESHWSADPRPVALGECGLDRFHLPQKDEAAADRIYAAQRAAFVAQLDLAKQLACPVVVHSRGAFHDCVEMVDASGVNWSQVVFHCFAEGPAEMTILRERGGVGSFTGILTYKNAANVREAAQVQGLDHLMLETDAPYLTPVPHRSKPNEPAYVHHTAVHAAELFGVDLAGLTARTTINARRFYGLA